MFFLFGFIGSTRTMTITSHQILIVGSMSLKYKTTAWSF